MVFPFVEPAGLGVVSSASFLMWRTAHGGSILNVHAGVVGIGERALAAPFVCRLEPLSDVVDLG